MLQGWEGDKRGRKKGNGDERFSYSSGPEEFY
jgi:hypothetical protein